MTDTSSGNPRYTVGYGRPPLEHRFKTGEHSRNPRGRPPGSTKVDPVTRILNRKIPVNFEGKRQRVTIFEAITIKAVMRALEGDEKAYRMVMRAQAELIKAYAKMQPTRDELLREMAEERSRSEHAAAISAFINDALERMAGEGKPERAWPAKKT